uniref:Uncharacterized protein n=1 Tax=Zeugodacus cucurbitae TaxID=28588 RepID=A0A0A1XS00_ZEUCU
MDTWAVMSQVNCGYTTLLEVYLQQQEARERKEMFRRKLEKARAQYALTHPYSDSETDDESYKAESEKSKRFCPDSGDEKDDSDEQAKANKSLIIKKIWLQKGKGSSNGKTLDKKKTTAKAAEKSSDDSVVEVVKDVEIVDLCNPTRENKTTMAPYMVTPTSSKRRNTKRRLKLD